MQPNKRRAAGVFLILGIAFLTIGLATENTAFSWVAIVFVILAIITSGRWQMRRKN